MMKQILITTCLLLSSSLALSLPHKKKLSFCDQLLTNRSTQHDLLLQIDDGISINVSQAIHLLLFGYSGYFFTNSIVYVYKHYDWNDLVQDITADNRDSWLLQSFLFFFSAYKVCNAERIVPLVIDDERPLREDSQLFG